MCMDTFVKKQNQSWSSSVLSRGFSFFCAFRSSAYLGMNVSKNASRKNLLAKTYITGLINIRLFEQIYPKMCHPTCPNLGGIGSKNCTIPSKQRKHSDIVTLLIYTFKLEMQEK